jgi:ABC-2 type transport system ATP-binding protein
VLTTTHYMDEAEYCNTIGMMYQSKMIALDNPDALKEQLKTTLLELDCDQPSHAIEVLKKIDGIEEITQYGVLLHITVADKRIGRSIQTTLAKSQIKVHRLDEILPSLEDIFINMVDRQESKETRKENQ